MKKLLSLLLLCAVLTGCESMSERMQERFAAVLPKTRVFEASKKTVYSLWVQYPEACFGLVGWDGEGWRAATSTRRTMFRC